MTISLIPINNAGIATGPAITQQTSATGEYRFGNLRPGRFRIVQTQPANFLSGTDSLGSLGGVNSSASDNQIDAVTLTAGANGIYNNFAELLPVLTKRNFLASAR